MISPPRRIRDLSQSENSSPLAQGRVPRQQSVASASPIPGSPIRQSIPSQIASPRYVKQFHALIEHQREVHSEERALWHTERAELQRKIEELEATVLRLQTSPPSQVSSPVGKNRTGSGNSFWSLLSTNESSNTAANTTGDEVWRPRTDVEPTRTFSDSSNEGAKTESRLPSIAENFISTDRNSSPRTALGDQAIARKPSISGLEIDNNLDGINFKPSGLRPAVVKNIMTPQSPSPQFSSPSRISPGTIEIPMSHLMALEDPYTKDAGHTPLARRTNIGIDGAASAGSSEATTPKQPELERPFLEPHATATRRPGERSESYFPASEDDPNDADRHLSAPLGLTNNTGEDKRFLHELNSKLLQAARSETSEPLAVAGASNSGTSMKEEAHNFEQPEHEPKLRIKRSMNFGSAFGAKHPGKGV